jgi:hypothetical protein
MIDRNGKRQQQTRRGCMKGKPEQTFAEHVPPSLTEAREFHHDTHPERTGRSRTRFTARRVGVLLSSLAMAGAGIVVGATPASAGSDQVILTLKGSVGWHHAGDKLEVADNKKDGLGIEGWVRNTVSRIPHSLYVAGAHTSKTRSFSYYPEGTKVQIRMCYRHGAVTTKCSEWVNAEA